MAFDLAKVETPSRSIPQTTFREETTMPRANTDRPEREVNAVIRRPSGTSNAEALAKLLGVATEVTDNIVGDIQAKNDKANEAQAAFDFASGNQNQDLYKNSRAYYQAWQLEGAKAKSLDIAQKVTDKVQEVLNDPNATAEDADAAIETVFHAETHDAKGNLLDFGTPDAKLTLGHSLAEVKAKLMPEVHQLLRERQNAKLMGTTMDNMFVERARGAAIGDPKAVQATPANVLVDPLAPLPATPQKTEGHILGRLSAPFKGFDTVALTGHLGDSRGGHVHNGEDFPVPDGTPITAPMAGKVIASFVNSEGGNQVRVKLANGAIVGFAHLSERHAQVGDDVNAGELLGLSGQTGHATGPHVHMTVEVNGKKVSPREYFKTHQSGQAVVETGSEPQLKTSDAPQQAAQAQLPGLDVEAFLSRLPPSITKSEGKTYFINAVIAKAYQSGDASLMNGLEDSKRPDGSPSFNPEEQLQIEKARDQIRDQASAEAERATKKLQSDNLDVILNAYNSDHPPSDSWLALQGQKGLIDPGQAYTLISHNRAMRREAASEARTEARIAQADREQGVLEDVNSRAAAMMAGLPSSLSQTEEDLRQEFQSGAFGPVGSKTAMAHYRTLLVARRQGIKQVESSPDFARYGAMLEAYKPITLKQGSNPLLDQLNANRGQGPRLDKPTYAEMTSFYKEQVDGGKTPGEAYRNAVDKYVRKSGAQGSGPPANAVNRISYLRCVRAGICQ